MLSHVQVYAEEISYVQFSPDSSKVLCITNDELIVLDVSHLPLGAATVTYNYPEYLPLIKDTDSMTDDQGWFRGRNGKRLLWLPVAFRQDIEYWAFKPDGKLMIVGKRQAPLFIDASDYIDNVETVKMEWRRGTVCSPLRTSVDRPYWEDFHLQRLLQRSLVDNGLA